MSRPALLAFSIAVCLTVLLLPIVPVSAATVYWDVNGTLVGLGGTGTWSTGAANWNTDSGGGAGTVAAWSNTGNDAVFAGTAGTATVAGTVEVNKMTFNTDGYQIGGTTLTLTGAAEVEVAGGITATTNNALAGTAGLTKTGTGTLVIDGNVSNAIAGGLFVNDGTVIIDKDSGTGFGSNQTITIGDNSGAAGSAKLQITGTGAAHFSNGSALVIGTDGQFDSGAVTKTSGGVTMANGGSLVVGTGALTIGNTTLNGGGSISTGSGTVTMANVTYNDAGGVAATISGNFLVTNGSIRLYSIGDDAGLDHELIFSATMTNTASGGWNKAGTGKMLVNGNSPLFTGTIQISNGILEVGPAANALGASGATIVLTNTTGILQSSDGTDRVVLGAVTIPGSNGTTIQGAGDFHFTNSTPIDLVGGSTGQKSIVINNPETTFEAGFVNSGAALRGITKSGTGTLTLNGNSTYDGLTIINAGVLRLGHANAIPGGIGATGGTNNVNIAGGVIGLGAADFQRGLGTGATQVQFSSTGGGFAAYGANRSVNLGGAAAAANWASGNFVPNGQSLVLGANDATHKVTFVNPINLNGALRTVQTPDGLADVDGEISGILSGSGAGLNKTGAGTLLLSANNSYTGATSVSDGTLRVDGSIASSSGVSVASGATLAGSGSVSSISGAGLVSPGTSPGIMTATFVNPSAGMDYAFEFTAQSSPNYASSTASVNDVLHLTSGTPFTTNLLSANGNEVNIYLNLTDLTTGSLRGGFYVNDGGTDFLPQIDDGIYNYYVRGNGGGSNEFNGVNYYTLAEFDASKKFLNYNFSLSTVAETANFLSGTVNGRVMQFDIEVLIVPEPSSALLLASGMVLFFGRRRRVRRAMLKGKP